jgi:hypothetical protein
VDGTELRRRIDSLGFTYTEAARRLGLTLGGLNHQMRNERPVSRQTTLLLEQLEREARVRLVEPYKRGRK